MKKLLFTLLLAAVTLPGWADDLYLVGDATPIGWKSSGRAITKMTEKETNLFEWKGLLEANTSNDDGFKVCNGDNSWNGYKATAVGQDIVSGTTYNMTTDGDNKWDITETGFYTVTVDLRNGTKKLTVVKESSVSFGINRSSESPYSINYCEIGSLQALKDFGNLVNTGTNSTSMNAKLTADITEAMDFAIGWYDSNTSNKLYSGEFDGNGHTVTLGINDGEHSKKALFGAAKGGANIHDLIVAGSVTAQAKAAGIIGYADGGGTITLTNVINTADIDSKGNSDANAAGLVGCAVNNTVINATNCANTGNVINSGYNSGTQQCAAFAGWSQDSGGKTPTKSTYTNCWNSGTISNIEGEALLYRNSDKVTATNCYYLSGTSDQGEKLNLNSNAVASGELCYNLNEKLGSTKWYQTLAGTDSHPCPFSTHKQVYLVSETSYSNIPASEGKVQISNAEDLVTFSAEVNAGNTALNAKLTNDIDMSGVNDYTPIGTATHLYSGTFDGDTHRIKNLVISNNIKEQGLFSVCTGATIKNLILDSSCSIKSTNSSWGNAAFVAVCNGSGTLTFENCGNEASVEGNRGNNAAFLGKNYSTSGLKTVLRNCYNTGTIKGGGYNAAFVGESNGKEVTTTNCYNKGTVERNDGGNATWINGTGTKNITNCYTTLASGELTNLTTTYSSDKITSGELCAKLGYGFRQNLGSDAYPNFASDHGFVAQIGDAGYSTMFNTYSDVEIPSGIEAYAGVVNNNNNSLSLVAIENKIAASEPVVLKGAAGLYNFMPTSGISKAANNDLKGSDGSATGGANIYALAKKGEDVGFYPVGDGVKIPEGKAYLVYTAPTPVKGFTFVFDDDATAIEMVNGQWSMVNDQPIFNLAGQRINKMQKGINIVNGKKVMVK